MANPGDKTQPYDVAAVPLGLGGLATHLNSTSVKSPSLLVAENVQWEKLGKASKRPGFVQATGDSFDTGGTAGNVASTKCLGLSEYSSSVVATIQEGVGVSYTVDDIDLTGNDNDRWAQALGGPFGYGKISKKDVGSARDTVLICADQCTVGNFTCYVWFDMLSGVTYVSQKDDVANVEIQGPTALPTVTNVATAVGNNNQAKIINVGGVFHIVHRRTNLIFATYKITPGTVTPYSVGTSAVDLVTSTLGTQQCFDICQNEGDTRGVLTVIGCTGAGGTFWFALTFNSAGTIVTAITTIDNSAITVPQFVTCTAENSGSNRIGFVAYYTAGAVAALRSRIMTSVLGNVAALTVVASGVTDTPLNVAARWSDPAGESAITGIHILLGLSPTTPNGGRSNAYCSLYTFTTGAGVTSRGIVFRHAEIASKFFRFGNVTYIVLFAHISISASGISDLNKYMIASTDLDSANGSDWKDSLSVRSLGTDGVVGSFDRGTAGIGFTTFHDGYACNVYQTTTGKFRGCWNENRFLSGRSSSILNDVEIDFTYANTALEFNRCLYSTGMQLSVFDGRVVKEQGFHTETTLLPQPFPVPSNGAGSLTNSATYVYSIYPEYTNARGQLDVGTCAALATVTMGAADDTVTFSIPTVWFTALRNVKHGKVRFVVYRSLASNPGGLRYRVADFLFQGESYNDVFASNVTFVDLMNDAQAATMDIDYLSVGELDNVHIGRCTSIAVYKDRLCVAGGEQSNTVYASKKYRPEHNKVARFNEGLRIAIPEYGGDDVTALASKDEILIVFKDKAIYYVSGDGPDDVGSEANGRFDTPRLMSSSLGAINQASVVSTASGVLFKDARKGIYIISGGAPEYIGQPVEQYNSTLTITRAVDVPTRNHVCFFSSQGTTLVYNYILNAWAIWTGDQAAVAACVFQDKPVIGRADGRVWFNDASVFQDNTTAYSMKVRTPWMHAQASLLGRILSNGLNLIAERVGAADLKFSIFYNYSDTPVATITKSDASTNIKHIDLPSPHQNAAFSVQIEDLAVGTGNPSATASFNLIELAFEVSRFMGMHQVPIADRG